MWSFENELNRCFGFGPCAAYRLREADSNIRNEALYHMLWVVLADRMAFVVGKVHHSGSLLPRQLAIRSLGQAPMCAAQSYTTIHTSRPCPLPGLGRSWNTLARSGDQACDPVLEQHRNAIANRPMDGGIGVLA